MGKSWTEEWMGSVGRRVRVVVDPCEVVFGTVTKVYPTVPYMRVKGDDGRQHYTHPRYARPVEPWEAGAS